MQKQFIPYEQALKLKELDFNEDECLYFYHYNRIGLFSLDEVERNINWQNVFGAPLWQQAFDWFRDEHNLVVSNRVMNWGTFNPNRFGYYFEIYQFGLERVAFDSKYFTTYKEARISCLNKLIEIIENETSNN